MVAFVHGTRAAEHVLQDSINDANPVPVSWMGAGSSSRGATGPGRFCFEAGRVYTPKHKAPKRVLEPADGPTGSLDWPLRGQLER
jgi:hypothetical protein